jgi:hypothetical protein
VDAWTGTHMQARVSAPAAVALQYREAMKSCSPVTCPHRHTVSAGGSPFDGVVCAGIVMLPVNRAPQACEMSNPA